MKKYTLLILFLLANLLILPIYAKDYVSGSLVDVGRDKRYIHVDRDFGTTVTDYRYHVRVNDITYVGVTRKSPKNWIVGDAVSVRFNSKKTKMYLKKPEDSYLLKSELKLKVVEKRR